VHNQSANLATFNIETACHGAKISQHACRAWYSERC
jgi:hypothetical protein